MHANVTQAGGAGGGSWRLPPDETLQVGDSKQEKDDVRFIFTVKNNLKAINNAVKKT